MSINVPLPVLLTIGALLLPGCAAERLSQQLPTIEKTRKPPASIQVEPGEFPNEHAIVPGLFPSELSGDTPMERFDAIVETGLENSRAFEVTPQAPGRAKTDARYLLEFQLVEMRSNESRTGALLQILETEKNEYATVTISYRLFNNASGVEIGVEKQITDNYLIKYNEYRLLNKLGLRAFFAKTEKENWPLAQATIRAIFKLVEDAQERVSAYEASAGPGDSDRV